MSLDARWTVQGKKLLEKTVHFADEQIKLVKKLVHEGNIARLFGASTTVRKLSPVQASNFSFTTFNIYKLKAANTTQLFSLCDKCITTSLIILRNRAIFTDIELR